MIVEDFKDRQGKWVQSFFNKSNGKPTYTWLGKRYCSMKCRAKLGGSDQKRFKNYKGCTSTFFDFQDFANWAVQQKGYAEQGFELDKDILSYGTLNYSKNTCVFVPKEINTILNSRKDERSQYGVGVKLTSSGKFASRIKRDGVDVHLGTFNTSEEAFQKYKTEKESLIRRLAEKFKNLIDERCFNALINYDVSRYD